MLPPFSRFSLALVAACVALASGLSEAHAETEMQRKIAEMKQRLEAERSLPEEQRWALEEAQLDELEAKAAKGDQQAASFLELAQVRMKKARRERLQKTWGRVLNTPDAPAELETHAQRMAQLRRIRFLALQGRYPNYAQRATELLKAEQERHRLRMKQIAAELAGGASATPEATPARAGVAPAEAPTQMAGTK